MGELVVGDTVTAEIVRIEEYGLWCRYLADSVRIRILLYNADAKKFRGTMLDV